MKSDFEKEVEFRQELCFNCKEQMSEGFCHECKICFVFWRRCRRKKCWTFEENFDDGPFFFKKEMIRLLKLQSFQ